MPDSLWPHGLQPTRLLCPWDFPGKDTGVGCHFLLQGIFPTQGSNEPCLLHCRQILYQVSYKGSPTQSLDPSSIQKVLIHLSVQTLWEQKHLTEQGSQFRHGGGGNVGWGDVCARRCVCACAEGRGGGLRLEETRVQAPANPRQTPLAVTVLLCLPLVRTSMSVAPSSLPDAVSRLWTKPAHPLSNLLVCQLFLCIRHLALLQKRSWHSLAFPFKRQHSKRQLCSSYPNTGDNSNTNITMTTPFL